MSGFENRLEERHEVYLPACISTHDGRRVVGIMCDISRSGGRMQMNRRLEVGSEVTVRLSNGIERTAIIRRCVQSKNAGKYDAGFELVASHWPDDLVYAAD